jgi:hypothetical protein
LGGTGAAAAAAAKAQYTGGWNAASNSRKLRSVCTCTVKKEEQETAAAHYAGG